MKQRVRMLLWVFGGLFILLTAGYFAIAFYYQEGFSFQTWINGIYCTGMTVEEANSELLQQTRAPVMTILDDDGESILIDLQECGYREDYSGALQRLMNRQNPFLWIDNLIDGRREEMEPAVFIEEALLREKWDALPFVREEKKRGPGNVELLWTQEGYRLKDSMLHHFDVERGYELLLQAFYSGEDELDLAESGLYCDLPYTGEQEELFALWEKLEAFGRNRIVFDMGAEQIVLTGRELEDFLDQDEAGLPVCGGKGQLVIDGDKAQAFITKLSGEYNTYGKEREFRSTRGDVVTVPAGNYGTEINDKKELEYLTEALSRCVSDTGELVNEVHSPTYTRQGYCRGKDDIGNTYIEIDITEQKMYFYLDGECLVDTDIVTGNLRRKNGTPAGVFYVYGKARNRILRGRDYASFVNYWVPVYKSIGIHDASWRKEFGGEIYKTNGSHGCINTPKANMKIIYENVEIGIPVVIFS